jgi:hypothetical protein
MSALHQLRESSSKKEAKLKRKKEGKRQKKELHIIKKEVFRTTITIYIELLASKLPLAFCESNESFGETRDT